MRQLPQHSKKPREKRKHMEHGDYAKGMGLSRERGGELKRNRKGVYTRSGKQKITGLRGRLSRRADWKEGNAAK